MSAAIFIHKIHPSALKEPCPDYLKITFNDRTYNFHFYINKEGRYVALCNTGKYHDCFGEDAHWFGAANNCMISVFGKMKIDNPDRFDEEKPGIEQSEKYEYQLYEYQLYEY